MQLPAPSSACSVQVLWDCTNQRGHSSHEGHPQLTTGMCVLLLAALPWHRFSWCKGSEGCCGQIWGHDPEMTNNCGRAGLGFNKHLTSQWGWVGWVVYSVWGCSEKRLSKASVSGDSANNDALCGNNTARGNVCHLEMATSYVWAGLCRCWGEKMAQWRREEQHIRRWANWRLVGVGGEL